VSIAYLKDQHLSHPARAFVDMLEKDGDPRPAGRGTAEGHGRIPCSVAGSKALAANDFFYHAVQSRDQGFREPGRIELHGEFGHSNVTAEALFQSRRKKSVVTGS